MNEKIPQVGNISQEKDNWPEVVKIYAEGKAHFEYSYQFSSGERLLGFQGQEGLGHVVIKRGEEVVFDLNSLLPAGFQMITPAYLKNHPEISKEHRDRMKSFFDIGCLSVNTDLKMILLRPFTSSRDFLNLLHEVGHTWKETLESSVTRRHLDKEMEIAKESKNTEQEIALMRETAKFLSASERDAWAWALRTYRQTEKETKIDFSEIFPSFEEIKTHINRLLLSYRWTFGRFTRLYDPDFANDLKKYFDKGTMEKRKTRGKIL